MQLYQAGGICVSFSILISSDLQNIKISNNKKVNDECAKVRIHVETRRRHRELFQRGKEFGKLFFMLLLA